jgi:predicted Zn-dependent peptidase
MITRTLAAFAIAALACGGARQAPAPAEPSAEPSGVAAGASHATPPAEAFRGTQPAPEAPRPFRLPALQRFSLPNGIEVFLVERHELPTVSMELTFPGGRINDPKGKAGLASVCLDLMAEGTTKLDKIAFREALADTASQVGSYAGQEQQGVSMATLTRHLDATLDLFADAILQPGFRRRELSRLVARRKEAVKQQRGTTASIAARLGDAIVYGLEHPYGAVQTEASVGAITLSDCRRYHDRYIKPEGAKLFVVGDITEAGIRAAMAERFARWRGMPKPSRSIPAPTPMAGRIFFVDVPGAAQSYVEVTHLGPPRNAVDFQATQLLATILGGGFSSRLNMNLREDKGYAYGASGQFSYTLTGSRLSAGARVQTDKTIESLREIAKELVALESGSVPASADELEREQRGAILSLPSQFATAAETLSRYQALVFFDLPLDYYDTYIDAIQRVDLPQLAAAAANHLQADELRALVVGDAGQVLARLRETAAVSQLGAGDLVILDADGVVRERVRAHAVGAGAASGASTPSEQPASR